MVVKAGIMGSILNNDLPHYFNLKMSVEFICTLSTEHMHHCRTDCRAYNTLALSALSSPSDIIIEMRERQD